MAGYRIPTLAGLNGMLAMVLGEKVEAVAHDEPIKLDTSHVARFLGPDDELVALCHCDLSAATALGCALSMIPPNAAAEMCSEGALSEMATGNLYEVMNIFSSLFMDDNSSHLRLEKVVGAAEADAIDGTPRSVFFSIPAGKYASGTLSFIVN